MILEEFMLYMEEDRCSKKTINNYKADVEKMLIFINKEPLQINKFDVISYSKYLEDLELNAKTVNRKLYAVYKFVSFLNDEYDTKIIINMKRIKMKTEKQEYGLNILTKTEFKKILNAAKKDENILFSTILLTLFFTGMRISEVLQLRLDDVNKDPIRVRGKGRKQRYVNIPIRLKEAINDYMKVRNNQYEDELALFVYDSNGAPVTAWMCDYWIKKYARLVKINVKKAHCHNIRHLFAYICLNEKGMSMSDVAQILGHSNINTTAIYTKKSIKELNNVMKDFTLD